MVLTAAELPGMEGRDGVPRSIAGRAEAFLAASGSASSGPAPSDNALYYIGGIVKHARALGAIASPGAHACQRPAPDLDASDRLAYVIRQRSASIWILRATIRKNRRSAARCADPLASVHLYCAALMMAGLDGIKNKILPDEAAMNDLYHPQERDPLRPAACAELEEALEALDRDRAFLTRGGVFSDATIDAFIAARKKDMQRTSTTTHPVEFGLSFAM